MPFFSTFLPVLPHCTLDIWPARKSLTFPQISAGRVHSLRFYNIRIGELNLESYQNVYIVVRGSLRGWTLLFSLKQTNQKEKEEKKKKSLKVNSFPCKFWQDSSYNIA